MNLVLELVLQTSNQLNYPLITKGPNTKFNPLSHTHRNSPECWKKEKKCKMSLVLALVLQASSSLWNPLITEGSNTELNPLSHMHRNSPECWENDKKSRNEPSVGVGASSIQPTSEPPRHRGPQHRSQSIEPQP
jgi:hypothetical protein